MKLILILFIFFIIFEILIFNLVIKHKINFKWIINFDDEYPKFNENNLKKFYQNSFDKDLGWDRKNNTSGIEQSNKKSKFKISSEGFRGKKIFKNKSISVFGDSFAFCRYVNDNETWEFFLEKKLQKHILNFGVGNYGLDQSFLKYLKYKRKIKDDIIIFNVVPETIARINSYWKHYREFGNIHAFKPIIQIKNGKLKIIKIKIKKYFNEKKIYYLIKSIKKKDIFYNEKFKKNIFKFPYTFQFLKNFKIYPLLLIYLSISKIMNNKYFYNKAIKIVLTNNISESHLMYKKKLFKKRLTDLIGYMNDFFVKNKKKMVLIITPQLLDLDGKNLKYSINYYNNLNRKINCIDLTTDIQNIKNYKKLYLKDIYGGHLNKGGNKVISNIIFKKLKDQKLI